MEDLSPEDPRTLGKYRLLGRLGAGGMGRVYLARSDRGRTVAVKLVQPELAGQEEFRRRFRQEVTAARRVGGEWTAPVLDADTEATVPWVATGYIAGPSLRQVVGQDYGPLPERSVRILAAGLARALQAVHAAGIVHRDLKPSNVLITLDGPRLIDFGIARALETVTDGGLTRTGAAVGSPGFMSPEQVRGGRITPASDIFCLGSVLAYAASGRMPFGTADSGVHALMFRIAEEEADLTGVPAELHPLISAFLAKDPADRPTPEQALERSGAAGLLADLGSAEPWLPGGLVAQLGRHAVRLLDVENPAQAAGIPPHSIAGPPTQVDPPQDARPVDPPTLTAPAAASQPLPPQAPHAAYGYPAPGPYAGSPYHQPAVQVPAPPAHRSKTPYIVAAIVAAGLLTGGGTVYLLNRDTSNAAHNSAGPGPSTTPPASSQGPASSAAPVPPTSGPATAGSPTPTPKPTPEAGQQAYLGTWQSSFGSGSRVNTRTITISRGSGVDVTIDGSGVLDDGTSYVCTWHTTATGGGTDGTPLRVGPSSVTRAMPTSACQPGSSSDLVLLPDGRMRRDFTDSATKDASLVYRKIY